MTEKEKALLNHFVRIWRAPYLSNDWKNKYYSEAEDFLGDHQPEWLDYITDYEAFEELSRGDDRPEKIEIIEY